MSGGPGSGLPARNKEPGRWRRLKRSGVLGPVSALPFLPFLPFQVTLPNRQVSTSNMTNLYNLRASVRLARGHNGWWGVGGGRT